MPEIEKQFQLGKNGITENFISTLKTYFEKNKSARISVLKSCCRDKKELKEISNNILDKLGKNYVGRNIGYTIAIKKFRKSVRA